MDSNMASFWHMRRAAPQARAAGDFFVGALHFRYNAVWRTRERYIAMFSLTAIRLALFGGARDVREQPYNVTPT
jgi:hypothetical protein